MAPLVPVLPVWSAVLRARAWTLDGRKNVPFIRCPVFCALGSATLSVASPAEEITLAVVDAS